MNFELLRAGLSTAQRTALKKRLRVLALDSSVGYQVFTNLRGESRLDGPAFRGIIGGLLHVSRFNVSLNSVKVKSRMQL
jgi:hypothetical protein